VLRSESRKLPVLLWVQKQVWQSGPEWVVRLRVQQVKQWERLLWELCLWALNWWWEQ